MSKTFFTSDTHFGHQNIAGKAVSNWGSGYRTFSSTEEMDETLIKKWNNVVKPGDTVYHLGDFSFAPAAPYRKRLNGNIHLMIGNHDKSALAIKDQFVWVRDLTEVRVDGQSIVLCHYPLESWNKMKHNTWMLHGHCHYSLAESQGKKMDVGVDNPIADYAPLSFEQIAIVMAGKGYLNIDHHSD